MDIGEHIKEHLVLGIPGIGGQTIVVGKGGFPATDAGLQAAIDAVEALAQMEESQLSGTVSCTIGANDWTHTVTGDGSALFESELADMSASMSSDGDTFISLASSGRKWYPIDTVNSDAALSLEVPYRGAALSGVTAYRGRPIMHCIKITENMSDFNVSIAGDEDGVFCCRIECVNGASLDGKFSLASGLLSGVLWFKNLTGMSGMGVTISRGANPAEAPVLDVIADNTRITDNVEWDVFHNISCGRWFGMGNFVKGRFDVFMPAVNGRLIERGSTYIAHKLDEADAVTLPNVVKNPAASGGTIGDYIVCHFEASLNGPNLTDPINIGQAHGGLGLVTSGWADGHKTTYKGSEFKGYCPSVMTEAPAVTFFDASYSRDSDIVLDGCSMKYVGPGANSVTPQADWYMLKSDNAAVEPAGVKNRVKILGGTLIDLPIHADFWDRCEITELKGDMGTRTASVTTGAVPQAEICVVRASKHIIGPMTGNVTIPAPAGHAEGSLPQGARIQFQFVEDGTAGRTVTWNAAYSFRSAGWTDSTVTTDANKSSTVEFEFDGTNWVQVSPDNEWI